MRSPRRLLPPLSAPQRAGIYLALVVVSILLYTVVYRAGMWWFEGIRVSYVEALHIVVEAFTTTGYGEDAGAWSSAEMLLLSIAMQLTGVVLLFLTLPLFLVPIVEESFRTTPPTETDLSDHVIVCRFTSRGERLVRELDSRGIDHVVVEPDRERAAELHRSGHDVVHGNPETESVLVAAGAADALALVADAGDESNASIILSARQAASDLRIVSLAEEPPVADYHRYAGADRVLTPRHLLGQSLASKAATAVRTDVGDAIEIGEDFEIAELLVQRDSQIVGQTVAESALGETGANVIGAWFRGEFASPPRPDDVIDEHTVLLVAGREEQIARLKEFTLSKTRSHRRGTVVVAGHGEVGSTAADALAAADVPTVVVDLEDGPGVDVVGDVTDRQTLEAAGVDDARTVVLALEDDRTAIFATLAISQFAPDVEVIARSNAPAAATKLYRAGAEYVLTLATVSGRILASSLLDEEVISPDTQIEVVRTEAPEIVGETLAGAGVRARTGCTVIAVERGDRLLTEVGPELRIEDGDVLVVAGLDDDINAFNELVT